MHVLQLQRRREEEERLRREREAAEYSRKQEMQLMKDIKGRKAAIKNKTNNTLNDVRTSIDFRNCTEFEKKV